MTPGRHWTLAVISGALLALGAAAPADAAISFVATNTTNSTNGTLTITKPTGTTTNDVLVAAVSGTGTTTMTAPSGWTLVADDMSGTTMRTLVFVKVAGSSEASSYSFTSSGSRNAAGGILTYRGVNTNVPVDAVATVTGASGNAVADSVTTSSANDFIVVTAATARSTSFTAAAGDTERFDKSSAGMSAEAADSTQASVGASGTSTVTPATNTSPWTAITIALRDNSAAGLSVSTSSASASFSANLNAGDATSTYTVTPTVLDTRSGASAGLGWQLQVTSTTLTTGARSLATTASSITDVAGDACVSGAPCVLPTSNVSYPVAVPAAASAPTAVKFDNAAVQTGEGQISKSTAFSVSVPQNAYAGTYTSTVTISIVSGP